TQGWARVSGSLFFPAAHKCDVTGILRSARISVVLAVGHANGSFISRGRYRPDGGFIAGTLFVDDYTRECNAGAVRRELWVGNPSEREKVFFCDGTVAGATGTCPVLLAVRRG